jgi:hypothetical protein
MDFLDQLITNNHYYLGTRNTGASGALRGDVIIIHVLVSDMASNWMFPMHVAEYQNAANQMAARLMLEAMMSGTYLTVRSVYLQAMIPGIVDMSNPNIMPLIFNSLGFLNASMMQMQYEQMYGCSEAPVIVAVNRPMRSFATMDNNRSFMRSPDEYCAVFRHTSGTFEPRVLIHELLHQFGAPDYYYPDVTVQAAYRHFPNSIMFQNGNEIDDLSKYLIGWTDTLTPTAMAFLRDTVSVNDAMLLAARLRGV